MPTRITLFAILCILLSWGGYREYSTLQLKNKLLKADVTISTLASEQKTLKEDFEYCKQNKPKRLDTFQEPYSFSIFGIYSPFFVGKEVETISYSYNRDFIEVKRLDIPDFEKQNIIVSVWDYGTQKHVRSQNPVSMPHVIFTNFDTPQIYDEAQWTDEYQTEKGIVMHIRYELTMYGFYGVYFEFIQNNSPVTGTASFVQLWSPVPSESLNNIWSPQVIQTVNTLKKFSDTIDVRNQ